ncbi:MAG: ATP-binding cassette domain-containing protein [Burkholderiales bacterium]|nr:ATP-binding cassette domain-containing protein [Burkholderiales bacterium]MCE1177005.1 ATP-binding cassette domain-containing protein [Burkholderiales bacterium]
MVNQKDSLMWALAYVARLQGGQVDRLRLHDVVTSRCAAFVDSLGSTNYDWHSVLERVSQEMEIKQAHASDRPDPARLPAISWNETHGWVIVRGKAASGSWSVLDSLGSMYEVPADQDLACVRLQFAHELLKTSEQPAYTLFKKVFYSHIKPLREAAFATALISLVALGVSLFSMQVYDRVIPTQGYQTLWVLTIGVMLSLLFDLLLKHVRSELTEESVVKMDSSLSRDIFARLLKVRLDQLPPSLGSLSAQIRGYEGVRSFLSSSTLYLLIELPFGFFFMLLIMIIGSPWLVLIPLCFYIIAVIQGLASIKKIEAFTSQGMAVANQKTGLLVEAIEGAETIKAGGGSWGILSRWIDINEESIRHDVGLRQVTEKGTHFTMFLQQATYIMVIAVGAYLVTQGNMTMGALIASSILTGRATGPAATLYQLMVRYATAKAALSGLENLYRLESDNHHVERPIQLERIRGGYFLENVQFSYQNAPNGFSIHHLLIKPGEKIGVLGPIGSGKSTLLRLLTGMYQPLTGKILLDGIDIGQISRSWLSEQIGYLQQEHRLFNGTLRENLLIGSLDPGDEVIRSAAEKTGLLQVISNHPKGLELPIAEGGKGLSGGQKQLVALTRLLISNPSVWLLDEPTASMDQQTAERCMATLREAIKPEHTLVLVTHNPVLLSFVDRLVVIANNKVVMDGPKQEVLANLRATATPPNKTKAHSASTATPLTQTSTEKTNEAEK